MLHDHELQPSRCQISVFNCRKINRRVLSETLTESPFHSETFAATGQIQTSVKPRFHSIIKVGYLTTTREINLREGLQIGNEFLP